VTDSVQVLTSAVARLIAYSQSAADRSAAPVYELPNNHGKARVAFTNRNEQEN